MNNYTTIRDTSTSHNTELNQRLQLGTKKHRSHYCQRFARVINPVSTSDCTGLGWWFIVFLRLQPLQEHGNKLCFLLYMPGNIYHSLAAECLTPTSSPVALTREQKNYKICILLQQNKGLAFTKRHVQRILYVISPKAFFPSTEAQTYYILNVTFMCMLIFQHMERNQSIADQLVEKSVMLYCPIKGNGRYSVEARFYNTNLINLYYKIYIL